MIAVKKVESSDKFASGDTFKLDLKFKPLIY